MSDEDRSGDEPLRQVAELRQEAEKLNAADFGRRQPVEVLREAEERYRLLFDAAPLGIGIADLEGNMLAANRAMVEMTGFALEELKTSNLRAVYVDPRDRERLLSALRERGRARDFETRLKRKDGTIYTALLNVDAVELAGKKALFATARDITDRKRAEAEEGQHAQDLEYLSRTALEFVAFPPEKDIYGHVAERLKEIVGDSIVLVGSRDETTGTVEIRSAIGLGKLTSRVLKLLNKDVVGMRFAILEDMDPLLRKGELVKLDRGMYELAQGKVPQKTLNAAAKLLGVRDVYLLGIVRERKLFASATILAPPGAEFANKATFAAFANQASVALQRWLAEEKEEERTQDLEYLSRTALEFVAFPPEKDIYGHVAERLKEIVGGSIVTVAAFDEVSRILECRAVVGIGKFSRQALRLLGRDPVGMRLRISEQADRELRKGKLVKVPGGLYVFTMEQIPRKVCEGIEKLLGLGDIYSIGFVWEGSLVGNASVITRAGAGLKNKAVVEAFVGQASVAFQRRLAEEKEKERTRGLAYLSRTALEFVAFPPEKDIYGHIAESLKEITGSPLVVVNSFDEGSRLLQCRSVAGSGRFSRQVLRLVGRDPVGMSFPISEEASQGLREGTLVKVPGGLYALALGQIPKGASKATEKLLGLGDIYAIGIARGRALFGSVAVATRKGTELGNRAVVEPFIHQASTAIQHKLAEEQLKASEEKYRSMVEVAPDGMVTVNMKGVVTSCNRAFLRLTGFSRNEIVGKRFSQVPTLRVQDIPRYAKMFAALMKGNVPGPIEFPWQRKDGTPRLGEAHIAPIKKAGKTIGLQAIARDITERERALEALRESEELHRTLLNTLPDAVTQTDLEGRITYVSERTLQDYGAEKADELIGRNAFELISPEDRERAIANLQKTLKGGSVKDVAYTVLRKDGSRYAAELSAAVVPDSRGKAKGFVAITRDITARKQAEAKLRAYQAQLRSLAMELPLAEERERRHLATWLHDNVAQTLALCKIKLAALEETASSSDIAKPLDELRGMLDQATQQTRSVVFELASPVLYELGLEAAVEQLCEQFQQKHGIPCKFEHSVRREPLDEEIKITLFRAVRELLVNIVKHARASAVRVSMRRDPETLSVAVEDNGFGFDASLIGPRKGRAGGFGLFSIKERLGLFGGELRVKSGQGRGTRATLVVPVAHDRPASGSRAT